MSLSHSISKVLDRRKYKKHWPTPRLLQECYVITRKEMTAIFNDFLAGRIDSAKENARKINLTEEAFQEQGGGLLWWFMIGVAAGMIIVAAATSH